MTLQEKTVASSQTTILSTPELISPALARDLQDYRKTSLNLLMGFLAFQSVSGSRGLAVATLTLILYTISLHITASAGVSHVRHFESLSMHKHLKPQQLGAVILGILHAIPAVGILAVTSVELTFAVKSPVMAVSIIISCFLPTMIAVFQYLRMRYMRTMIGQLPMTVPGDLPSEAA
ncbi:uncharacterized protein BJ212DRAFT_1297071 [Suillus subaureus]|uniref:Uncharacterized protein n=1 Tax=Suillus subaureus TaxID=48587 RepID=A0A9P7JH13_9AGAM|nr:uncharacterized protein BJ212DRAFT_1297071 [Suillus subaureus]KAG1821741.1 hypothetical protein BJ212DRAFT_1297071 [Suillus subaureus]